MATQTTERRFLCPECGNVEFAITVEPSYPESEVIKMNPGALAWLEDCQFCPCCGEQAEPTL